MNSGARRRCDGSGVCPGNASLASPGPGHPSPHLWGRGLFLSPARWGKTAKPQSTPSVSCLHLRSTSALSAPGRCDQNRSLVEAARGRGLAPPLWERVYARCVDGGRGRCPLVLRSAAPAVETPPRDSRGEPPSRTGRRAFHVFAFAAPRRSRPLGGMTRTDRWLKPPGGGVLRHPCGSAFTRDASMAAEAAAPSSCAAPLQRWGPRPGAGAAHLPPGPAGWRMPSMDSQTRTSSATGPRTWPSFIL